MDASDSGFPEKMAEESRRYLREQIELQKRQIAEQHDVIAQMYVEDLSTGLYNRNQCNELLQNEDVIREQTCLMIFDLNGLKKVNDTFGHEAGNTLIRCFAKLLQQQMPEQAFLGRYGGDEFIAIIKNCDRSMVCGLLAKIADAAKQYNQTPGANIPLTYAAGYALSDECPGCTMAVLLEKADFDMYQNKRAFYNALS